MVCTAASACPEISLAFTSSVAFVDSKVEKNKALGVGDALIVRCNKLTDTGISWNNQEHVGHKNLVTNSYKLYKDCLKTILVGKNKALIII